MQHCCSCFAGRAGSSVKYAPLLDALSAQLKQLHWEEASGLRQVPVIPTHPSGDMHMPASPTASQLYGMPGYQPHPQPHIFHAPAPGNWQVHPAAYPHYGGVSAAAQDLADQEPFPYFMQARCPPDSCLWCTSSLGCVRSTRLGIMLHHVVVSVTKHTHFKRNSIRSCMIATLSPCYIHPLTPTSPQF